MASRNKKNRAGHGVTLYLDEDIYRHIQMNFVPKLRARKNDYTLGVASVIVDLVDKKFHPRVVRQVAAQEG